MVGGVFLKKTYFDYEYFVISVFHRHHCSRKVDNSEDVLTYFEYKHSVLAVFHRHCSRIVDGDEVLTYFAYKHSVLTVLRRHQ